MFTRRGLSWILGILLIVGAGGPLAATMEEARETYDEFDEELGEITEENIESTVSGIGSRADYDSWQVLVRDIVSVAATGADPAQDPVLVQKIRQSGDPRVFAAINHRMEQSAHAFKQGGLVEMLPITGAVFEQVGGASASFAPHLKTGGSMLSGALLFLFGLRILSRGRKAQ